jgi:hypothetical protein
MFALGTAWATWREIEIEALIYSENPIGLRQAEVLNAFWQH